MGWRRLMPEMIRMYIDGKFYSIPLKEYREAGLGALEKMDEDDADKIRSITWKSYEKFKEEHPNVQMTFTGMLEVVMAFGIFKYRKDIGHE